jgi:hypothetical protein
MVPKLGNCFITFASVDNLKYRLAKMPLRLDYNYRDATKTVYLEIPLKCDPKLADITGTAPCDAATVSAD